MRFSDLALDVRYALRQLRRAPGFTTIAVATLALGVGANSAIFALADAALLRPLPFAQPDQLVMVWERRGPVATTMPSPTEFQAWASRARSLETMAALAVGGSVTLAGPDGLATLVPSMTVQSRFFDVLGVPPLLGRAFLDSDVSAAPTVVVLSEGTWRTRFDADPGIVGRSLVLSGRAMTVVGVVPERVSVVPPFAAGAVAPAQRPELYTLASFGVGSAGGAHFVHVIGRLRNGVAIEAAQGELDAIARDLANESSAQAGHGVLVQPLRDALIGTEVRRTSLVLLAVVGFVLLMCCANLANLLLARSAGRARELAVRTALGAARRRVVLQLLTESLVLAVFGGVAGAVVAMAILRAAGSFIPPGLLPNAVAIPFDIRVALFCAGVTIAVGLGFGIVPAWQATGTSPSHTAGGSGRVSRGPQSATGVLVALQVAAAILVVSGSGLLLRTWSALSRVDPGHRATDLFTAVINLPFPDRSAAAYPDGAAIRRFQEAVTRELDRQPEVRRVAWGGALPLDGGWFAQPVRVSGDTPREGPPNLASYLMVSRSYFDTLGIQILRGRGFSAQDADRAVPVCIVSDAFARRYFGGRNPLGARIEVPLMAFGPPRTVLREVVGVVRQVKDAPGEAAPTPQLYVPIEQNAWWSASLSVEPADGEAEALALVVRRALARVDPTIALRQPRTMARVASEATARPRFRAMLVAGFALLGLGLAAVGIFGVLTQVVGQRTREFGVRIALGARPREIAALVAGSVARSVGFGVVAGLVLAVLFARTMAAFLFGVAPLDPFSFAAAVALLALTAALAAVVPARCALRVDPAVAFRSE